MKIFAPKKNTNPFLKEEVIDKRDVRNALAQLDQQLHEVLTLTEKCQQSESVHDEMRWATDISGLEITMTNVAEMIRERFV